MIILLNGIDGSGKTTIGDKFKELGIPQIKSFTTKPKEESDGDDYIRGEVGELMEETEIDGEVYGTPLSEIHKIFNNKFAYKIVDKKGANFFREKFNAKTIVLSPPLATIEKRLSKRGMTTEEINKIHANKEDIEAEEFDLKLTREENPEKVCQMCLGLFGYALRGNRLLRVKKRYWTFATYIKGLSGVGYDASRYYRDWFKTFNFEVVDDDFSR